MGAVIDQDDGSGENAGGPGIFFIHTLNMAQFPRTITAQTGTGVEDAQPVAMGWHHALLHDRRRPIRHPA